MLGVAHQVVANLGADEFRDWLKSSVGALRVKNPELIEAIWALQAPIATTNYDDLLIEGRPEQRPWTWLQHAQVLDWAHGNRSGIFHFHGHWDSPESVVLDPRSYQRNLQDDKAQAVLQALGAMTAFLYIGCGEGLADPHFESFREWLKSRFAGSGFFHYRLCLEKEAAELEKKHSGEGMRIVSYGADYGDLAPFLRSLAPGKPSVSPPLPSTTGPVLPGRPICFGRTSEVETLVAAFLAQPPEPVVVVGGAGMGKSTITLEALHDPKIREWFGKRRFFVRCDGAQGRETLAQEIARTLGLVPQGSTALESQICNWLEASPALLVLDNAETPWEVPEETTRVEELFGVLASVPGLAFAVSLRGEQFPGGVRWGRQIRVGPLSPEAARQVFQEIAGPDFSAKEKDLGLLLRELDYWALPVTLLAHQAQSEPNLPSLRQRWEKHRTRLLQRAGGKEKATSLNVSLELSYDSPRLTESSRRLLSFLGVLPDGISPEDLPALLPEKVDEAAALLRQAGLALRTDPRLRVLAPVREWIAEAHPPVQADLERTLDHFVELARLGDQVGRMGGAQALARLLPDLRNLESAVTTRLDQPDAAPGIQAARDLAEFFRFTGWGTSELLHKARRVAKNGGDQQGEANCLQSLGNLAFRRSQNEEAREHWEKARSLFLQVGDQLGEANCVLSLGEAALQTSTEDPRPLFEEALALYKQVQVSYSIARAHRRLARISEEPERSRHVQIAREIWAAQDLPDLVVELDREFGTASALQE
jgi:tetratricopeptide (TPR) repeat protein